MLRIAICFFICGMVRGAFAQAVPTCASVSGDQILGADLARAVPALAGIPAKTPLAPTPMPGSMRVFPYSELQSIAARYSKTLDTQTEVCFRLATAPLDRERVNEALHASLASALKLPNATVELIETSTEPAPLGTLVFTPQGLSTPASPDQKTPVLWRGDVVYAGDHHFPIWARVRITAPVKRIVATEPLRNGVPIRADQLREETVEIFPSPNNRPLAMDSIPGLLLIRSVAAGAEIRADNLTRPYDVNRGDMVQVDVHIGAAHLAMVGKAESAGKSGETIAVRNTDSNKLFRGTVDSPGHVTVTMNAVVADNTNILNQGNRNE